MTRGAILKSDLIDEFKDFEAEENCSLIVIPLKVVS